MLSDPFNPYIAQTSRADSPSQSGIGEKYDEKEDTRDLASPSSQKQMPTALDFVNVDDGTSDSDALSPKSAKDSASSTDDTSSSTADIDESRTTILPPGAVESRNYTSPKQISAEIQAFIRGTDGNGANLGYKSEFRTFFTIWMFLTRLPSPSWIDLHPGFLMRGMCYFPIVGSILGGMYAIVFDFLDVSMGLPATVAAAVAIGSGLYITGCFHEDGLADSADGLGGGWSKSQVLKIMTDSRVGTFGCASLSLFLFIKLQLLGALGSSSWTLDLFSNDGSFSSGAGPAILVAQTLSRLSAPYLIRTRDYVAEVGPKSPFYLFMVEAKYLVTWPRVLFAMAYCFLVSTLVYGPVFALVLITAVLTVAHLAGNKGDYLLGGVMGDFLGATICITEMLLLILIVAKDSIIESYQTALDAINSSVNGQEGFNPLQQITALYSNDQLRPLIHFVFLATALKIWCTAVGGPDMYDREERKDDKDNKKKDD